MLHLSGHRIHPLIESCGLRLGCLCLRLGCLRRSKGRSCSRSLSFGLGGSNSSWGWGLMCVRMHRRGMLWVWHVLCRLRLTCQRSARRARHDTWRWNLRREGVRRLWLTRGWR